MITAFNLIYAFVVAGMCSRTSRKVPGIVERKGKFYALCLIFAAHALIGAGSLFLVRRFTGMQTSTVQSTVVFWVGFLQYSLRHELIPARLAVPLTALVILLCTGQLEQIVLNPNPDPLGDPRRWPSTRSPQ
jgi:hypothetical protein